MERDNMKPMSLVMEDLRRDGYTCDFEIHDDQFRSNQTGEVFQPEDLAIIQTYRFEGESDPGDMTIVYAMEAKSGTKGLCVDAFGTNASRRLGDFMKQVRIDTREPQGG
jgi:hypothetical protein